MKNKKVIVKGTGILLALVLLLSVALPVLGGGADPLFTDAVFTVGTASADAGDVGIVVPVYVENCPPFVALGLQFTYDTSALTLTEIALGEVATGGSYVPNPGGGIVNFDWYPENQFTDGEIFVLKFDVASQAGTGNYPIGIDISDSGWANDVPQELTGTFVPGNINVDGIAGVALYNGMQYPTLHAAIDDAALSGEPGTVKLLDDITVKTVDDRIIIPEDAGITLDMNGHTVTSEVPVPRYYSPEWTVEVEDGASLNLVSTGETRGKFEHATCPEGCVFLLNSGTINMSNVDVENFNYGVFDGSKKSDELFGSYGTFEDCDFTTKHRTFYFGNGSVEAIKSCHIEVTGPPESAQSPNWLGVNMAFLINKGATLELLEGTCIEVNDAQDAVQVGGHIETIRNCTIVNNDLPYEIEEDDGEKWIMPNSINIGVGPNGGSIGTITDTSLTGTLSCGGKIDLIEGDDTVVTLPHAEGETPWNWHTIKVAGNANDPAYIGEIAGGTFEEAPGMTLFVGPNGDIGTISGGEFSMKPSSAYYPVWVYNGASIDIISGGLFDGGPSGQGFMNQGTIGEISGAEFIADSKTAMNNSGGTIGTISGGLFTTPAASAFSNTGTVESISGGLFESKTYPLNNAAAGTINSISGGVFRGAASTGYGGVNYGTIYEITDGSFVGADKNGLLNWGGTIGTISGGSFHGKTYAIANTDKSPDVAKIQALSGGYYKGTAASKISTLNADCQKPAGYSFATVPMRESDFGEAGFHHFGETVDITWEVEGQEPKTDKFVIGDPIYYAHDTPTSDAGVFRGWSDGENEYGQEAELPLAAVATTYEAQFAPPAEDYLVSLEAGRDDINAGEEFAVDVVITSEYNEDFYGATVEVDYESDKVDYKSAVLPDGFGLVEDDNVLKIVGAASSGYEMDADNRFVLAKLTFQAKSNVSTGEAVFSIGDRPIVNQEDAVYDQIVPKGGDLTLSLWNLQITFKAGYNVDLEQSTAYVKYDEAGLWTDTSYTTAFDEPSPSPHAYYTLDDPLWKPASGDNVDFAVIEDTLFTADAVYTANASPSNYEISYPESVAIVSGVEEGKVTYLTPVLFTVTPDSGYRVNRVSYTVGTGEPEVIEAVEGRYTIPGNKVTGDIVISVEQVVDGMVTFISNDEFYALPAGYQVLLLTVESKLTVGAYEYDGNAMFYSSAYSKDGDHVYVYVVPAEADVEDVLELLELNESGDCEELSCDGDVNLDERLNSTDVVLIYGLYKGIHKNDPDFAKVTMRMRLEADVNGDQKVDTSDAQAVLDGIWGTP